ncbi:hypothetical protein GH714_029516 [Hevea brasiliensis]|uniref:V-type proton ATPase subunit C n=1 Tax=Hevea brasiliensis TaxID=3981 RepID=A0A6A6LMZ2_HEVBR|nr:hypothetical protein GH714_029516 [Hevea brasiliensis]
MMKEQGAGHEIPEACAWMAGGEGVTTEGDKARDGSDRGGVTGSHDLVSVVIDQRGLSFLFQKELKNSDVSSLKRMIVPKGNSLTRMDCPLGDFIVVYKDDQNQNYVIQAKKASDQDLYANIATNAVNDIFFHDYEFNIPNLRVGTLDSLLSLSDDLLKSNSFIEGVSHKIRRQIEELERVSGVESSALTVDGVPVDSYLTRFIWDEAKYPTMSPLREIVDSIHTQVAKIEDDLKVRVAEYNNVRSQLNAINRKQSGSLAVRDLSNLVKPEDIISSEHLVTLLAIIPKYSQKDWLASYETLTSYVVPRSSKKLHEDNEYALYTVMLFRRVADNFRTSAREKGFQACVLAPSVKGEKKVRSILEGLCDSANRQVVICP